MEPANKIQPRDNSGGTNAGGRDRKESLQHWEAQTEQARRALRSVSYLLHFADDRARQLAQEFRTAVRGQADFSALADMLEKLVKLADGADPAAGTDTAPAMERPGLLARLFGRSGQPTDGDSAAVGAEESLQALRGALLAGLEQIPVPAERQVEFKAWRSRLREADQQQLSTALPELMQMLATLARPETPADGGAASASATAPETPPYNEIFVQVIESLALPEDLQYQARIIRDRLLQVNDPWDPIVPMDSTISLVADMRGSLEKEKAEFQAFLIGLAQRLNELESGLTGAGNSHAQLYRVGSTLEATMQSQVNTLETTIDRADNVGDLKSKVKEQLSNLRNQLQEYRQNDQRKQQALEQELTAMRGKLSAVESQTEQLRVNLEKKHRQAIIDPLTGVHNRLALQERLQQEYAKWKRYKTPLALIVADFDHFKRVNDTFGHLAGDNALKYVAKLLQQKVRETDFLCRYGGEEFVILLPHADGKGAQLAAEKLRAIIEQSRFHSEGRTVPITLSMGIACFRDGDSCEEVFKRADAALYLAKQRGRNRCCSEDDAPPA